MDFVHNHNSTQKTKHIRCLITKILIFSLVISCIGCSPPAFRVYEGPRRPSFSASRIITKNEKIWFTQVDNIYLEYSPFKARWYNAKYAQDVEVLPGKHQLYILHKDPFTQLEFKVILDAKAGHTYEVDTSVENFTTVYRVIDLDTHKTIITRYGDRME
jgi:hypothetical protein